MMGNSLTVHNAELKTASVEIKTLSISGKQVTLSVFRQIPEKLLINTNGSLNGVPWGRVNYFWGANAGSSQPEYQHVIWQNGLELFRSILSAKYYRKPLLQAPYMIPVETQETVFHDDGRTAGSNWVRTEYVEISHHLRGVIKDEFFNKHYNSDDGRVLEERVHMIADRENKLRSARSAAFDAVLQVPQIYIAV